ncbi:MAG: redoxin family protein [Pirellulales bacterium]|nr:redoxin family protein [Pirellulales bacterium]
MVRKLSLAAGLLGLLAVGAATWWFSRTSDPYEGLVAPLGQPVTADTNLRDIYGNERTIGDFAGNKAVVVCFLSTGCPLVKKLMPELKQLEAATRPQGAQFLAVYPNQGETINDIAAHAADYDVPFAVLKDYGQGLADALGAKRTPEFCVLDAKGVLVYRGWLSDRVRVNGLKIKADRNDLAEAIGEVLHGKKVTVPKTEADGCLIDRDEPRAIDFPVTFADHVAPILQEHCEVCHRAGSMGPFSLSNYDDARDVGAMIKEVAVQRRMPPWHADARYGVWQNDRRLTEEQITLLAAWFDAGMPSGDLSQFQPKHWSSEWAFEDPDFVVEAEKGFDVPADGVVPYQYIWAPQEVSDAIFTRQRWLVAGDVKPGVPQVVHHLMVYAVDPGAPGPQETYDGCRSIGSYVPGTSALVLPPETAMRVNRGSRICFEMHYTPYGKPAYDQPKVALKFRDTPPEHELQIAVLHTRQIAVPAQAEHYEMHLAAAAPYDSRMLALMPHLHMRGKSFKFELEYPPRDGEVLPHREILLNVPRIDYFWQTIYWFKDPPFIPQRAAIRCTAHWDNSSSLANNPDPNTTVRWGPQSTDEMFVAWLFFVRNLSGSDLSASPSEPTAAVSLQLPPSRAN